MWAETERASSQLLANVAQLVDVVWPHVANSPPISSRVSLGQRWPARGLFLGSAAILLAEMGPVGWVCFGSGESLAISWLGLLGEICLPITGAGEMGLGQRAL